MNHPLPAPSQPAPDASSDDTIALVQRHSLTRLVAEALEKLILSGELPPGGKLNEAELAGRFRVSRGPLREALRLLEESGLIRQEKNRGAYVREISLTEAAEIYQVRAGLDATAGRLLAARITPAEVGELRGLTERMREIAPANDVDGFHALNLTFHDRIITLCGNGALRDIYHRLVKQLALFRRRNLLAPLAIPHFAEEHSAIVDRLEAGDADGAAALLLRHAEGGRQRMLQQPQNPEAGDER